MMKDILRVADKLNLYCFVAFYVLAYSNTVCEAGKKMHISQPAITKMINKLEDAIGIKLFIRSRNGAKLTTYGEILLPYVEQSLCSLVKGINLIESDSKLNSGKIIIGTSLYLSSCLLKIINDFKINYPSICIEVIVDSPKKLIELLSMGKIDFIIDSGYYKRLPDLVEKSLVSLESCFAVTKRMPIKNFKDLENVNILLPSVDNNLYRKIMKNFDDKNIKLNYIFHMGLNDNVLSSVKEHFGVGFVIKDTILNELNKGTIQLLNLPIDSPNIDINILHLKNSLSKNDKKFIEYCKNYYNTTKKISV